MGKEETGKQPGAGQRPYSVNRRTLLKCMAWAGTGALWSVAGGVPRLAGLIGSAEAAAAVAAGGLHFAQISDSHLGFAKEANPDVPGTVRQAIGMINALPTAPAFVVHTGDVTHLSKPAEFDLAEQLLSELKAGPLHVIPGEHDVLDDTPGALFRERFARDSQGDGWYSFDQDGVHFVALVNVVDLKAGGLGNLGTTQLEWLEGDLKPRAASTPIVVLAHIPLWTISADWGWGTSDSEQALSYLRRFGSVTVLNGHIHQVMQKVEGNISFHTALSTAYPQPAPGTAPSPGPLKVPAEQLRQMLGVASVDIRPGAAPVALTNMPMANG
jgi:3',5'-cyclic-AMP phosphodiesterase